MSDEEAVKTLEGIVIVFAVGLVALVLLAADGWYTAL